MDTILVPRDRYKEALDLCKGIGVRATKIPAKGEVKVFLKKAPKPLLLALMQVGIPDEAKAQIEVHTLGGEELLERMTSGPKEVLLLLKAIGVDKPGKPRLEYRVNGNWYALAFTITYYDTWVGPTVYAEAYVKLHGATESIYLRLRDGFYRDDEGVRVKRSLRQALEHMGLRMASKERLVDFRKKLARTDDISGLHGKVMTTDASVLVYQSEFWAESRLMVTPLGSKTTPARLIVESELEASDDHSYRRDDNMQPFPMVRCFSPDLKEYVYTDVDSLKPYEFDVDAINRLILPPDIKDIVTRVFTTPPEKLFGDMFKGRHGGMVILANGPSGVGKTLTAEVFSECTKRPLYTMEIGELGTDLESVEGNLRRIFARAARWNAVLLFDEADIFMAERGSDLERNAIVGVFLRLLDYFRGMFFLTSNRAETIDEAFGGRITLSIDYPDLDAAAREKIWALLLGSSGLSVNGDLKEVAKEGLNGRQIRNMIRLMSATAPEDRQVTPAMITSLFKFAARRKKAGVSVGNGARARDQATA